MCIFQVVQLGLSPNIVYVCYSLLSSAYFCMPLYKLLGASLQLHHHAASLFVPLIYFRMASVFLRLCQEQTKGINLYHSGGVFLAHVQILATVNAVIYHGNSNVINKMDMPQCKYFLSFTMSLSDS